MTQTISEPTPSTTTQLVLNDISWETYKRLLEVFAEHPMLRMTYCKGTLELMTPLPEHETYRWNLVRLVVALSKELGLEIRGLKSTTWRSQFSKVFCISKPNSKPSTKKPLTNL